MVWDQTKPRNTEKIRDLGNVIRPNWKAIEENDTAVKATSLNQWVIHLIDRSTIGGANTPARVDDVGMIYCKNDGAENELFFQDSQDPANEIQLSQDGSMGSLSTSVKMDDFSFDTDLTYNENNIITAYAITSAAGAPIGGYNLNVVSGSAGIYTYTFADAATMDGTNYVVTGNAIAQGSGGSTTVQNVSIHTKTDLDFIVNTVNSNGTYSAVDHMIMVVGGRV